MREKINWVIPDIAHHRSVLKFWSKDHSHERQIKKWECNKFGTVVDVGPLVNKKKVNRTQVCVISFKGGVELFFRLFWLPDSLAS